MSSSLTVNKSRCTRVRWRNSSCRRCIDVCRSDAISIDQMGISVNPDLCTNCMLCASECPTGALLSSDDDIRKLIAVLDKSEVPTIGCRHLSEINCHFKAECLGFLSERHLMILMFALKFPLQLNLTSCSACANGHIVTFLESRIAEIKKKFSDNMEVKFRKVKNKKNLVFKSIQYNRRQFFREIKDKIGKSTTEIVGNLEKINPSSYKAKVVPDIIDAFNALIPSLNKELQEDVLSNYSFAASIGKSCNYCLICVATCPTGALVRDNNDGRTMKTIKFYGSKCCGCDLCVESCARDAISVQIGSSHGDAVELTAGIESFAGK